MKDKDKYFFIEKQLFPMILREIKRADDLYPSAENDISSWIIKILEELGEFSKEVIEGHNDLAETELIQMIGLSVNLLYDIYRGGYDEKK